MTIYLVRHGKAGDRGHWDGPDDLRPLSKAGRRQALGLADELSDAPIEHVVTSPFVRCRQSVEPLAERLRLPVDLADELAEGALVGDAFRLIDKFAYTLANAVLCTHGDVMGNVLDLLARRDVPLGGHIKLEKGCTWVFDVDGTSPRPSSTEMSKPFRDVDALVEVLAAGAREDDGEALDALAHHLQCAAVLAERAPDDVELQVAGLVHDVASTVWPGRPATHARAGAALIEPLLGSRVAWLVGHHDEAKRYLVTTEPAYRARLSATSVVTLEAQGGLLGGDERAALQAAPELDALLTLRRADDDAKVPGRAVPGLDAWRGALDAVAQTAT
jgi:predicted HD phosphohydrolase/phosphohistidine phosphatase SixA